MVKFFGYH
jgi:hypothetical protein